jgi:radical SAM protein with 4Fe4S-binding SPASM domain
MVRKLTEHAAQLKRMYSVDDGRLKGEGGWQKFPLFWFQLFLSYKCTRRCNYCYSFNQVGFENKSEMDDRTFARLLEWIPEVWRANGVKVNAIGFLGGEPLLRTDRIRKVMQSVFAKTPGMQGTVYTNGDLVDSVNWDDLEDIQWASINITDISIEELARRLKIIGARSNVINQTIIATLDDYNLERILEISRFGIENGYRLRFNKNVYRGSDSGYKDRLLQKYHEICDLLEEYIVRGYNVHTIFLLDMLIPSWNYDESPYPCGKRTAVVFPDGTIGPCIRDHSYKTGSIFDADPLAKLQCSQFHFEITQSASSSECLECSLRTTCQGGCPHDKLLWTGTAAGKSVACEIHREIIPRLRYLDQISRDRDAARTHRQ